jgi:hypothetical protein
MDSRAGVEYKLPVRAQRKETEEEKNKGSPTSSTAVLVTGSSNLLHQLTPTSPPSPIPTVYMQLPVLVPRR